MQTEFLDQRQEAASLGRGAVSLRRLDAMLVGLPEAAQIGHYDVILVAEQPHDVAKVRMVSRLPVQQKH
jgi:hypothetical protein